MEDKLLILNQNDYIPLEIAEKIINNLYLIDFDIKQGSNVLLKPNIVSQNTAKQATITHFGFVESLCILLKNKNCNIIIGESSAYYQKNYTDGSFITSGIKKIAQKYNAKIVSFEKEELKLYTNENNKVLKDVLLTKWIEKVDYIINLPKLKTHSYMKLSCGVKNLFGFVPGGTKMEYHFLNGYTKDIFGDKLCDIFNIIRPSLTIMDGIISLEGEGPSAMGTPKDTKLIAISKNPYAMDFIVSKIIGYNPEEITYLKKGIERNFLIPSNIKILGNYSNDNLPFIFFKKPKEALEHPKEKNSFYKILRVCPIIKENLCRNCMQCVNICPLKAITKSNPPIIDTSQCLNCYNCFYNCPYKAIKLKGTTLTPIIDFLRRKLKI
ncbi:MAG: hypothetical protein A2Y34_13920 [Spirochaetes bacterium GWC1_27_15]|nr:MAG: hypothetical protein A2Y34_13920 [Spirochaetes bacterium GWC1_27_15]